MDILRQPTETYVTYLKRIVNSVTAGIIDYSTMGDCLLGEQNNYSSENLRKAYYVLKVIINKLDNDISVTESAILTEIEKQKEELFKEITKNRDKQREIRNDLRKMARYENLEQVLSNKLKSIQPKCIVHDISYNPSEDTEASLLISDIHYGIVFKNAVNEYNCQIAESRLNILLAKTIQYCEKNKVCKLNVEILGDLVSGIIHVGSRVAQEEDIISQIVAVSSLLTSFINTLSVHIPNVNVYCVFGNHARVIPSKQDSLNCENFERLIYKYISMGVSKCVSVHTANATDFLVYNTCGKSVLLTHGDKDTVSNSVEHYTNILGYKPDEIHMGHYHSYQCCDNGNSDIIVNGSVVGTDDYALSIRKHTKPCQMLRIYDKDTATYKLELG